MPLRDLLDLVIKGIAVCIAMGSAYSALSSYRLNAQTKTAEFLLKLHQSFFVDQTYQLVRQQLDDDSPQGLAIVAILVHEEGAHFTDFLNFFEMIAYMEKREDISLADAHALFGYYLRVLAANPNLRTYLKNTKKSFEHLDALLSRIKGIE